MDADFLFTKEALDAGFKKLMSFPFETEEQKKSAFRYAVYATLDINEKVISEEKIISFMFQVMNKLMVKIEC